MGKVAGTQSPAGAGKARPRQRAAESRDAVDAVVVQHQVNYSLIQLRLAGVVLVLAVLGRLLLLGVAVGDGETITRLAGLSSLATQLPLLPLGITLCLLAGGRMRHKREVPLTLLLHRSLAPLAVLCLVVLPAFTLWEVGSLRSRLTLQRSAHETVLAEHRRWLAEAEASDSAAAVAQLAASHKVELPVTREEPAALSRWRLRTLLAERSEQERLARPLLRLSPYELEVLGVFRTAGTVLLQIISGAGLLLLRGIGRRHLRRHSLKPAQFLRSDVAGRRRWG